jgi:hypothetical protein
MKRIYQTYTQEVYAHLRPLHANWEPAQPVRIGDFGVLNGRMFLQKGNVDQFEITCPTRESHVEKRRTFCSSGMAEVRLRPRVSGKAGRKVQNARAEIRFSSAGAVYFNAADCTYTTIQDKVGFGAKILALYHTSKWKSSWVVVTDLVTAGSTTIAISREAGAYLELQAGVDVAQIDLANASLQLQSTSTKRVGYEVTAAPGLTPLIGLSKVHLPWFREPGFDSALVGFTSGTESEDEWVFGNVS